ncbi:MAG: ferrous iron transport protein A [Planctomycetota bacterium]|nr:ferrous iron transport protein A [Planctomycetota bacterium]
MTEVIKPLHRMKEEERGVVFSIEGGHMLITRLGAMGLRPGVPVRLVCAQPARGPVVVEVLGRMRIALGRGVARKVLVKMEKGI